MTNYATKKNLRTQVKTLQIGNRSLAKDTENLELTSFGVSLHPGGHPTKNISCKKVMLPTMEGISFEKVKDILYLEASGNYTLFHFTDGRQSLVCRSLCDVENRLPSDAFIRIHRSHTIHLRHMEKYVKGKGGYVILKGGRALTVSSGQKEHLLEAFERFFA